MGEQVQNEDQMLVLRDNARDQLIQIKSIEDAIPYLSKMQAFEKWLKAEKKDAELQNLVAEQKLRTQRILGQLIQEGQDRGEIAAQETGRKNMSNTMSDIPKTLPEVGLTHQQSSRYKAIASIPEDIFDDAIQSKKAAVDNAVAELTTAGMLKLAKETRRTESIQNSQESSRDAELINQLKSGHTVVLNMKTDLFAIKWATEQGLFVQVDRTTEWGNPFAIGDDGTREEVCYKYANHYFPQKDKLNRIVSTLRGKALGCWCAPSQCHADHLKMMADEQD